MIKLIFTFIFLIALQSHAQLNLKGEFLTSGDIVNPTAGQVIITTGQIDAGAKNRAYFDVVITLQSTVNATFLIGVYNAADTLVKSFKLSVSGTANSPQYKFEKAPIPNNFRLKITTPSAITGTVNCLMNLKNVSLD